MESGSHCVNQVDCSAPNNMAGVEALLQASIPRFPLFVAYHDHFEKPNLEPKGNCTRMESRKCLPSYLRCDTGHNFMSIAYFHSFEGSLMGFVILVDFRCVNPKLHILAECRGLWLFGNYCKWQIRKM